MATRELPFVVRPRLAPIIELVGDEKTGQLEIERRGYITVGEKAMVQQTMEGSRSFGGLLELAEEISRENDKNPQEVLDDISKTPSPEYLKLWMPQVAQCLSEIEIETSKRQIIQATTILVSRVDEKWTVDDTLNLNDDLIVALSNFYIEEERKDVKKLEGAVEKKGAEGNE